MNPDLFPETLLVTCEGDRIYTTSLKVAEHFHKRHKNVLQSIENLLAECPDEVFNGLNFQPVEYLDAKGERRKMYKLTEEGFALLAMGFTGKEALRWKINLLNAFMAQRAALAKLTARYAHVVDVIRPNLRPVVEGTEAGLNRASIAGALGKSANAITYHRRQARRFGLLGGAA
ncbi:MAG: Rha family transcriptional regulator [Azonexus sp.]|jgi:Rha family phage regulatory protein|nr:Rha family transcriptional regulator [Azonexus sp.]